MVKGVGTQVDREASLVCLANRRKILGSGRFVRVGEASLALIGYGQSTQGISVDLVVEAGEVTRLVVSPQLIGG